MLTAQFIGLNIYFAVNLMAALVAFGVFWLIYDAWTVQRSREELLKWAGFLVLSVGFLLRAASLDTQVGGLAPLTQVLANLFRIIGYLGIGIGQFLEPLQAIPELSALTGPASKSTAAADEKPGQPTKSLPAVMLAQLTGVVLPAFAVGVAVLYWRRATVGLERHLRPVAYGFAGLAIFELLSDVSGLTNTSNPVLSRFVASYGPVWWAALVFLFASSLILGIWVWHYLVKRLQSQLFIMLIAQTLVVFLCSTVGFTFLLLQGQQTQSLTDLSTASHVLNYAVKSLGSETAAQVQVVSANSAVVSALEAHSHDALVTAASGYLTRYGLSTLTITDGLAQVMLRGEDPSRWGDSISSDPLVRRSLVGEASSSVVSTSGVVAPVVTLTAAGPVRDLSGNIIGSVTAGRAITTAFVDGIRTSTGLDSSVYGGNVLAATTLTASDGSRAVGVKETNQAITNQVLNQRRSFVGNATFQNRSYLAAFTPLLDVNNTPVGMLLVARPADSLLAAGYHSIQLTFLFVVGLIVLLVYPIYLISRYLSRQLK
jgi:hypothetical protein